MQTFTAAPHHDVLILLIQLAVLLGFARLLAEGAQRLGQPAVVGEILAGVILGPSLLSGIFPELGHWIVPQSEVQGHLLETVAMIGALFLLLITGLETDIGLIRRHARVSIGASIGGIVLPFLTGFLLGQQIPDSLLADPNRRLVFSLFLATAMSISAIPVIAKVLIDLKLMRRDIGQSIIAAGMTDDAIGWMLLSVVIGLASSGSVEAGTVAWSVGKVLGFLALSILAGRWLVRVAIDRVQDRGSDPARMLTLTVVLMFAWGALTQGLGLEAVFGSFVMGILLAQMPRLPGNVRHDLERITLGVFAPIFFAVAGLKVNARALMDPRLIGIALIVILVASLGKVVGGYAGARYIGRTGHWEALSFGAGMNARGAMEIIIATIGLSLGILTQDMFSIIVVMAIATSLMAPPALRWTLRRVRPSEEEELRLKREELEVGSAIAGVRRVLIPVPCRREERRALLTLETHLLKQLHARNALAVTLLTVTTEGSREFATEFLERLEGELPEGVELSRKIVEGGDPTDVILDEAAKDYDLLIIAAPEENDHPDEVFTPRIDHLLRLSPCTAMVVQGRFSTRNWPPRRVLTPTNGSLSSRAAVELGFAIANSQGEVLILNVVEDARSEHRLDVSGEARRRQTEAAHGIVEELQTLGDALGVCTLTQVRSSPEPEQVILQESQRKSVDLLILGINVRAATDRLTVGPRVERVLHGASCPIVLLNTI